MRAVTWYHFSHARHNYGFAELGLSSFRAIWLDFVTREVYITLTRGILLFVVSMAHIMRIRSACAMQPCSELHKTEQNTHSLRMPCAFDSYAHGHVHRMPCECDIIVRMAHKMRIRSACAMRPRSELLTIYSSNHYN